MSTRRAPAVMASATRGMASSAQPHAVLRVELAGLRHIARALSFSELPSRRRLLQAASEIDCTAMRDKADVNRNGTLEGNEATAYLDAIKKSGEKYIMKTVDQLSPGLQG